MKKFLFALVLGVALAFAATSTQAHAKEKIKTVKVTLTEDNTISLRTGFNDKTTANLVHKARQLDARLKSKDPIFLVLNSPGGSVSAGLNAIQNLRNMNRKIHTISLFSASMGFETVQSTGARLIPVDGTLMAHKGWFYWGGEYPGQFDNRYAWMLRKAERMSKRVVARTKGKHTLKSYSALIENEYWCDGVDCIKQGLADYIVRPTCDKSLAGSYVEAVEQLLFFGFVIEIKVEFPECPLNKGYLAYDIYIDGQPIFGNIKEDKNLTRFSNEKYNYETGETVKILNEKQLEQIKEKVKGILDTIDSRKVIVSP